MSSVYTDDRQLATFLEAFMSERIAIRLENLSKTFGRRKKRVTAVSSLNLEIEAGAGLWFFRA